MAFIDRNRKVTPATPTNYVPGDKLLNLIADFERAFPVTLSAIPMGAKIAECFGYMHDIYRNMWIYWYINGNSDNQPRAIMNALISKKVKLPGEYLDRKAPPADNLGTNAEYYTKLNKYINTLALNRNVSQIMAGYNRIFRTETYSDDHYLKSIRTIALNTTDIVLGVTPDERFPSRFNDYNTFDKLRTDNSIKWNQIRVVFNLVAFSLATYPENVTQRTEVEEQYVVKLIDAFRKLCRDYINTYTNTSVFKVPNVYRKKTLRNTPLNAREAAFYVDNAIRIRLLNLIMAFTPTSVAACIGEGYSPYVSLDYNGWTRQMREDPSKLDVMGIDNEIFMFDPFKDNMPHFNLLTGDYTRSTAYINDTAALAANIKKHNTIEATSFDEYFARSASTRLTKLRYGQPSQDWDDTSVFTGCTMVKQFFIEKRNAGPYYVKDSLSMATIIKNAASAKPARGTLVTEASLQKWLDRIFIEIIKAIPTSNLRHDNGYHSTEQRTYYVNSLYQNLLHLLGTEAKILETF